MYLLPSKLFCVTKLCYKYYDYITDSFTSIYACNTLLKFSLLREHFNIWQFHHRAWNTEVWTTTLRKMFCESWRVLMLVLKCLKALGAMLFARFACSLWMENILASDNSWISNMHIQILHAVLHTFLMVLVERICSNIKTFHHWWWSFPSFSWMVCLIRQYCC